MRTDRELLIECVKQLKHIDEIYDFEPLDTTTSLIREVQQALNIPLVSVECEHPFAYVHTRCMGEINHCLKCGKDL